MKYVWHEIEDYINELTGRFPSIESIWLFGSRINGTSRPDSDWDLLVFGTKKTIDELRRSLEFRQDNIDLLVVYNGNDFIEPWPTQPDSKEQKCGSLDEWCWKKINQRIAFYQGTKEIEGHDFYVETKILTANRIFPE